MYYTITNTIGTRIDFEDGSTLECGVIYDSKRKAPKDADYVLAYSKVPEGWRFDGKADLDTEKFVEEVDPEERDILAWKSEKINIQAKIRPSKDSKKAIAQAERAAEIAEIERQFKEDEIDAAEFGKLAIAIAQKM
jgi:hypothetical protein